MEKILIEKARIDELKAKLITYIDTHDVINKDFNNTVKNVREMILKGDRNKALMVKGDLVQIKKEFGEVTAQDIVDSIVKHCVIALKPNQHMRMKRISNVKLKTSWDN